MFLTFLFLTPGIFTTRDWQGYRKNNYYYYYDSYLSFIRRLLYNITRGVYPPTTKELFPQLPHFPFPSPLLPSS